MGRKALDLLNVRFGKLIVVADTYKKSDKSRGKIWLCHCDCGNAIEVVAGSLSNGSTKSCGCFRVEHGRLIGKKTTHGATIDKSQWPVYRIWVGIKRRCTDENYSRYKDYGGRGITLYNPWLNFQNFCQYVENLAGCPADIKNSGCRLSLTIDRIKNNQGYLPGNIRWATKTLQANNRRNNRIIRVNGVAMTLANTIRKYSKVSDNVVRSRLSKGWSIKEAILTDLTRKFSNER